MAEKQAEPVSEAVATEVAAVAALPASPVEPRVALHDWAADQERQGAIETLIVYVAQENRAGHIYDTASTFARGLAAMANVVA